MTSIPRFSHFDGYETIDFKEFLKQGLIEIHLEREKEKPLCCFRCKSRMAIVRGRYRQNLKSLPILGFKTLIKLWRLVGYCEKCKKARSEDIDFVAKETPHMTQEYAWWLGRMCEIAAVSRVAEFTNLNGKRVWTLDYRRMKRMLENYRIPNVSRIAVDEVYARKKRRPEEQGRDDRYFTIISDLDTHKVIWVADSRRKEALDQFFILIGEEASKKIVLVAADQHDAYAASVREHCPNADLVWDRFHLMQAFEEAVNETRKELHLEQPRLSQVGMHSRGQYRFIFLKKDSRRTETEKKHINAVLRENSRFAKLEIIKERMLTFFDQPNEKAAKEVFDEVGDWIWQENFKSLMKWHKLLEHGWQTLKNYFKYRVTSALAEGINNVVKALKRRAYGYKNMEYFKLKIMQTCGYLNSRFIPTPHQLLTK